MIGSSISENLSLYIRRARMGDMEAFGSIVKYYQKTAFNYAYRILGDSFLAEDALQEAFCEAYLQIRKLRNPSGFYAWFRCIVKKQCDRLTRRKMHRLIPLENIQVIDWATLEPADRLEKQETINRVKEVLEKLSEKHRKAVFLYYIDGYNQTQAAQILGISLSAVKKRLFDARAVLKTIYGEEDIMKTEEIIRGLFKNRVSDRIFKKIMKNPKMVKLKGERVELTTLVIDLCNFDQIINDNPPNVSISILNDFFNKISDIIKKRGGMIDKFIGDAVVCFWGSPLYDPDSVKNACKAALEMNKAIDLLAEKWKARDLPEITSHIGINTGKVIVGNIGSSEFMQFSPIGHGITLAAELERMNRHHGTRILISEFTKQHLSKDFHTAKVGSVGIRHFDKPVEAFELIKIS